MSLIVCYIILIFEVFTGFWCLYRSFKYICNQNQKTKNIMELNEKKPNILIVIPCLREQDIIIQTLNYFLELTNDLDNVKLLVVTTQKEEFEKENNLHLKDQFIKDVKSNMELQKLINKYNKILSTNEIKEILKCSKLENIEEIINNKIQKFQTTNTLIEDFIIQNHLKERIYHFHYPDTKGIMADQLNYVLNNFEFKDEKNYYFSVYNADSIPNKNTIVVGHGMYIRVDLLKKIGGFETKYWCEDIYMSYVLRNKGISIYPIKTLEIMQSPQYLSILTKQNAVWFKTSFECLKIFKDVFNQNRKLNLNSIGWLIQRIRMNITWLGLPLAFLYTIIISILNKNIILFVLSILSYFVMIMLEYGSTIKLIEKLTETSLKNKIKILCNTILATSISNIGPIYSLVSRKKEKYKTVR